ncbi:MAG: phosphoribosyl-AMP cyclohydrolase [Gammaproteobacteria bacterium]|nr:MAG: phosphoribosyl-AMP cyclohydrolase [Gammaproteobacteria bacterium]
MKQQDTHNNWLDQIQWNDDGLIPAIAQDIDTNDVLMMAWMSPESLRLTVEEQRAVYWSRSRARLWRKGESSGNVQKLHELRLDCDRDVLLLKVEQIGQIACHTGRHSCFYFRLEQNQWNPVEPVIKDPNEIYKDKNQDE